MGCCRGNNFNYSPLLQLPIGREQIAAEPAPELVNTGEVPPVVAGYGMILRLPTGSHHFFLRQLQQPFQMAL